MTSIVSVVAQAPAVEIGADCRLEAQSARAAGRHRCRPHRVPGTRTRSGRRRPLPASRRWRGRTTSSTWCRNRRPDSATSSWRLNRCELSDQKIWPPTAKSRLTTIEIQYVPCARSHGDGSVTERLVMPGSTTPGTDGKLQVAVRAGQRRRHPGTLRCRRSPCVGSPGGESMARSGN